MTKSTVVFDFLVNVLSICTFFIFLYSFVKLKDKNHGFYIILALNISDCLTSVFSVATAFVANTTLNSNILGGLMVASERFSIFWTTAFAIYSHLILRHVRTFKSLKYIKIAFPLCLIASILNGVMIYVNGWGIQSQMEDTWIYLIYPFDNLHDSIICFLIIDIITKFIPMIIVSYCYFQVYKDIKCSEEYAMVSSRYNLLRVLWFPFSFVICYVPSIFGHLSSILEGKESKNFLNDFIFGYLIRFWTFFNLLGYWFLKPQIEDKKKKKKVSEETALISSSINTRITS